MPTKRSLLATVLVLVIAHAAPSGAAAQGSACQSAIGGLAAFSGLPLHWSATDSTQATLGSTGVTVSVFGDCRYAYVDVPNLAGHGIGEVAIFVANGGGALDAAAVPAGARALVQASGNRVTLADGVTMLGLVDLSSVGSHQAHELGLPDRVVLVGAITADAFRAAMQGEPSALLTGASLSGAATLSATSAFGVPGLSLSRLSGTLAAGDVHFTVNGAVGSHALEAELDVVGDDAPRLAVSGALPLSAFPGFSSLPGTSAITLDSVSVQPGLVTAATSYRGHDALDAALFEDPAGHWSIAMSESGMPLTSLVGLPSSSPLHSVHLPRVVMLISRNGFSAAASQLPGAVQSMLDGLPHGDVMTVPAGEAFIGVLEVDDVALPGAGLGQLGFSGVKVPLVGALASSGSSEPVTITAELPPIHPAALGNVPGWVVLPTELDVSMEATTAGDFEVAIAIPTLPVRVRQGGRTQELHFAMDIDLAFVESGMEVGFQGHMADDWQRPFGIHGLTLLGSQHSPDHRGTSLSFQVGPEITVSLEGAFAVGHDTATVAAEIAAAGGIPDAAAFRGTLNRLTLADVVSFANTVIHDADRHAPLIPTHNLPSVEIDSVVLALASPGSDAGAVGLSGPGIGFSGSLLVNGRDYADMTIAVDENGLMGTADAHIPRIGPIDLGDPVLALVAERGQPVQLTVHDRITLGPISDSVAIHVGGDSISFASDARFGGAFDIALHAVSAETDPEHASFTFDGSFENEASQWFSNQVHSAMQALKNTLTPSVDQSLVRAVQTAEQQEQDAENAAKRAQQKSIAELDHLQARVDSLQSAIHTCQDQADHYRRERNDQPWYRVDHMAEYEAEYLAKEIECAGLETMKATADILLDAAKGGVHAVESPALNPAVIAARAELDVARTALVMDSITVSATRTVVNDMTHWLSDLASVFSVDRIAFSNASLDALEGRDSLDFDIAITFLGKDYQADLALDWGDTHVLQQFASDITNALTSSHVHDARLQAIADHPGLPGHPMGLWEPTLARIALAAPPSPQAGNRRDCVMTYGDPHVINDALILGACNEQFYWTMWTPPETPADSFVVRFGDEAGNVCWVWLQQHSIIERTPCDGSDAYLFDRAPQGQQTYSTVDRTKFTMVHQADGNFRIYNVAGMCLVAAVTQDGAPPRPGAPQQQRLELRFAACDAADQNQLWQIWEEGADE